MGTQHFIILVAGIVVASVATIVAIQVWDEGRTEEAVATLTQDLTRIASEARTWKSTPQVLGGQPRTVALGGCAPLDETDVCAEDDWRGFTSLGQLGFDVDDNGIFTTRNGRFILSRPGDAGQPPQIMAYNEIFDVAVVITVETGLPVATAHGQGVPEAFPSPVIRISP